PDLEKGLRRAGFLDEGFGAGPRDQDRGRDDELESHEFLGADDVGHGLAPLAAAADDPAELRLLRRREGGGRGAEGCFQGQSGGEGRQQLDVVVGMVDAEVSQVLPGFLDLVHAFFASALSFSSRSHLSRRSISSSISPWRKVSRLWTDPEAPSRMSVTRLSGKL